MNILVTGHAGFVGSYMCRELLHQGHNVIGLDNFHSQYSKKAKLLNIDLIRASVGIGPVDNPEDMVARIWEMLPQTTRTTSGFGEFTSLDGDILDTDHLKQIFSQHQIDAVVHIAALASVPDSMIYPIEYVRINVEGTTAILDACSKHKVSNIVLMSTSAEYGNTQEVPTSENVDPNHPISPYGSTKRMAEIMAYTFHFLYGQNITLLRPFTIYGPLQRPYGMAIQKFIKQTAHDLPMTVYGDGSMARDYVYVTDVVDAIALALQHNQTTGGYNTYNVGSGVATTLTELTNHIRQEFAKGEVAHLEIPPTEVQVTQADISKIGSELGYTPKVSLQEGLKKQIEVFKILPDWFKEL